MSSKQSGHLIMIVDMRGKIGIVIDVISTVLQLSFSARSVSFKKTHTKDHLKQIPSEIDETTKAR